MNYRLDKKIRRRLPRRFKVLIAVVVALIIAGTALAVHVYNKDLKPVSSSQTAQIFTISPGSSVTEIANQLQKQHLIRSAWAFELYMHAKGISEQIQAGTYSLTPSQSLASIVSVLTSGKVTTKLVTIIPGHRIDQVRTD